MLIIPYVCADFHDKKGNPIFRITADMLRTMQDVPEAIKQDLLFDMLVQDGSIKTPETVAQRKLLEQDPMIGMNADGRSAVNAGGIRDGALGSEAPEGRASGSSLAEDGREPRATSRNERAVRGTVATIEAADKEAKAEKAAKPAKTETKAETKTEEKPADLKPAGTETKK